MSLKECNWVPTLLCWRAHTRPFYVSHLFFTVPLPTPTTFPNMQVTLDILVNTRHARSFILCGHMLHVTLSNLIGSLKTKTADSAQPRNRSTVTRPFSLREGGVWVRDYPIRHVTCILRRRRGVNRCAKNRPTSQQTEGAPLARQIRKKDTENLTSRRMHGIFGKRE